MSTSKFSAFKKILEDLPLSCWFSYCGSPKNQDKVQPFTYEIKTFSLYYYYYFFNKLKIVSDLYSPEPVPEGLIFNKFCKLLMIIVDYNNNHSNDTEK